MLKDITVQVIQNDQAALLGLAQQAMELRRGESSKGRNAMAQRAGDASAARSIGWHA